jgi:8-oxo-dGTP pyrophosphatase MutT (NUDIX family)
MIEAACVLVERQGKILAVKTKGDAPRWAFPGGKVEQDEAPIDTAFRETFEETGIIVDVGELVHKGIVDASQPVSVFVFRAEVLNHLEPLFGVPDCTWGWVFPQEIVEGAYSEFNTAALRAAGVIE